jgi:RNA polymerase sigma-70 factor (ECF subfamily)
MPGHAEKGEPSDEEADRVAVENVPTPGDPTVEGLWDKEWEENLFEAAVDRVKRRVKEEQFQMFDLYVVKKWPVGKVAQTLGANTGQVYLAKHRIGGLIRKEVQRLEKNLI